MQNPQLASFLTFISCVIALLIFLFTILAPRCRSNPFAWQVDNKYPFALILFSDECG